MMSLHFLLRIYLLPQCGLKSDSVTTSEVFFECFIFGLVSKDMHITSASAEYTISDGFAFDFSSNLNFVDFGCGIKWKWFLTFIMAVGYVLSHWVYFIVLYSIRHII